MRMTGLFSFSFFNRVFFLFLPFFLSFGSAHEVLDVQARASYTNNTVGRQESHRKIKNKKLVRVRTGYSVRLRKCEKVDEKGEIK